MKGINVVPQIKIYSIIIIPYLSVPRRKCVSKTYIHLHIRILIQRLMMSIFKEIEVKKMPTMPLQSTIGGVSIQKVFLPFRFMRPATNVANTQAHNYDGIFR